MRRLTLLATAIAISFTAVPASFAAGPKTDDCGRDKHCTTQQHDNNSDKKQPDKTQTRAAPAQQSHTQQQPATQSAHKNPARGDSGRDATRVTRNDKSKFGPAPYHNVDDHLVLVDSSTLRIMSVLGLTSVMTR